MGTKPEKMWVLRGRSIDGTVYRIDGGWTTELVEAWAIPSSVALAELEDARARSRRAELDDKIGHLLLIPAG